MPAVLLAYAGLLVTVGAMAGALRSGESFKDNFGIRPVRRTSTVWLWTALGIGAAFAVIVRLYDGNSPLPVSLAPFLVVAAAIGATEELVFRGFLQGRLARYGAAIAVTAAAVSHTAYKTLLFALPPEGVTINLFWLAFFTLLVGGAFGYAAFRGRSVIPAIAGHVLFDILVYGDWAQAPWWVWGGMPT